MTESNDLNLLVTELDNSIKALECQKAESLLAQLDKQSMTPEVLESILKKLNVNSMGALRRRVTDWCFKAKRNKDLVESELGDLGFEVKYLYLPKVIFNADRIQVSFIEKTNIATVTCIKDGMKDFNFEFNKDQLIYLFKKQEGVE